MFRLEVQTASVVPGLVIDLLFASLFPCSCGNGGASLPLTGEGGCYRMGTLIHGCVVDVAMPFRFTQQERAYLLGEKVVEGLHGGEFVVFDVEDGVELGDVEHVLDFLGEAEELEFAAGVADRGVAADQFADAGGVDVIDMGEVEHDFFLALGDELVNGVAEPSLNWYAIPCPVPPFALPSSMTSSRRVTCVAETATNAPALPFKVMSRV